MTGRTAFQVRHNTSHVVRTLLVSHLWRDSWLTSVPFAVTSRPRHPAALAPTRRRGRTSTSRKARPDTSASSAGTRPVVLRAGHAAQVRSTRISTSPATMGSTHASIAGTRQRAHREGPAARAQTSSTNSCDCACAERVVRIATLGRARADPRRWHGSAGIQGSQAQRSPAGCGG